MKRTILILIILTKAFELFGDSKQEQLTNYLSTLVAMPTQTADKEENKKAIDWVEKQLTPLGLHIKRHSFNGYSTLVATTQPTQTPDLFLVAHIDVVPASLDLFAAVIDNEKLFGRGVYDMKMAIACYLLLFKELERELNKLNIGLMITSDEEVGGMNGVKQLLDLGYSSKIAFLPDGGFNWNFEEEAKGVLQLCLTAKGKAAHSSRPELGESALLALLPALQKIQTFFDLKRESCDAYYPTCNLGVLRAGEVVNQVPDCAQAHLDIRYPFSFKRDALFADLLNLIEEHPLLEVKVTAEGSSHQVDLELPPFLLFKRLAKELHGIEVGKMRSSGASDARFFGEKNIPVLVIAPRGGEIHSQKEWIDLKDLTRFYIVLKEWVIELKSNNFF